MRFIFRLSCRWAHKHFTNELSQNKSTLLAVIGALFFILSDTILASNKFHALFKTARFFTLITYFTGKYLIALSVGIQ
ncbi:MAG TPA: hypothetical protein ENH29_09565 [Bacteroidetes bacterium]|nr:hypothetical protein [Bacteroidota bacterium]